MNMPQVPSVKMNINTSIYKLIEIYFPESRLLRISIDREYLDYYIYVDERDAQKYL